MTNDEDVPLLEDEGKVGSSTSLNGDREHVDHYDYVVPVEQDGEDDVVSHYRTCAKSLIWSRFFGFR